jgi:putative ABC transport system permease protein
MVSGGQLATNEALKQFKTLGTDLLAVSITDTPSEDHPVSSDGSMNLGEALQMAHADSQIRDVAPYTQIYNPALYQGHAVNAGVLGVTEGFAQVIHVDLAAGRFISDFDKFSLYCVVGQQVYEQLKRISYREPLGQQIQVGSDFFTIIGVAKAWPENSFLYASVDGSIMVPILSSMALSKYALITNFILRLAPAADIDAVNQHVTNYINHLLPGKRLYFRSAKELLASMGKQNHILTIFLGLIGSISLIVGGIGVMNIMLVSVIERRREIGIRLAVGARRRDIRTLFLLEAVMLALVGGLSGVIIGMVIAYVIALFWHWEFIWFFWPPLIGFSVSVVVGVFFGFYPAYKASQLDPIEALRSEI